MAINHLLKQTVIVSNPTGPDVHNKQGLGTPVTYNARFEQTYKILAAATLEQIPINGIVFLAADAVIQLGAKVTYAGVDYRAMVVSPIVNGRGKVQHIEVMVQNWSMP